MRHRGTHRYARVDGVRIHWVEMASLHGESGRPPLILLHGLNDCYRTWRRVAPLAAGERRVLMPDLPGHGLSERPDAGYELAWHARVVTRWLDVAGVGECDVAGHSFGGGVAQRMLLERPNRIRRLALVASGGLGREVSWLLRLAALPVFVERFGQPFMAPCTRLALCAVAHLREDVERLTSINGQKGSARAFARTVRDVVDWRGQTRAFLDRAAEIDSLPAIGVFWGDRDPIIPPAHAHSLAEHVDGVRVSVFDGCGHYLHHERTEAFAAALLDFLDDPTVCRAVLRDDAPCVRGQRPSNDEPAPWSVAPISATG